MSNIFSSYLVNKKLKKSESLCTLARLIILDPGQGLRFLQEFHSGIITKIKKKNTKPPENLAKKISSQFISGIKSFITTEIPIEEGWKQEPEWYIALEVYKEAVLICPKNPNPRWQIIAILHRDGRNDEAFAQFSTMPNQKIDEFDMVSLTPNIVGMLVSVGRKKEANDMITGVLHKFLSGEKHDSKEMFLGLLLFETYYLTIEKINDFIDLIKNIDQSLITSLAKNIANKARIFINKDNLREALAWINVALDVHSENQEFLNIKKEIEQDLKEGNTWDSIKSEAEFFNYLYRRLAHRFHPDLAKNDNERTKKTKIMSEINRARSDNNLGELKKIAREHASDWIKYFKF